MTTVDGTGASAQTPNQQDTVVALPVTLAQGLTVPAYVYLCARCGCLIPILVPQWLSTATAESADSMRITLSSRFWQLGDLALCGACRLTGASAEDAPHIDAQESDVWAAARAAGMPSGPTIVSIYFRIDDEAVPPNYHGWFTRLLGIFVAWLPAGAEDHWPGLRAWRFPDGAAFVYCERRHWREGKPGAVVFTTNPARGKESLHIDDSEALTVGELKALMTAADFFRVIPWKRGGRDRDCFRNILTTIRALVANDQKATQIAVAKTLYGPHDSARGSLTQCLRRERILSGRSTRWPDVVRLALSEFSTLS